MQRGSQVLVSTAVCSSVLLHSDAVTSSCLDISYGLFVFSFASSTLESFLFFLSQIYLTYYLAYGIVYNTLLITLFPICLIFKDSLTKKKSEVVEKNYIKRNLFFATSHSHSIDSAALSPPAAKATFTVLITCDLKVVTLCLSPTTLQLRYWSGGVGESTWKKLPSASAAHLLRALLGRGLHEWEQWHVAHHSKSHLSVFSLLDLSLVQAKQPPSVFLSSSVWIFR